MFYVKVMVGCIYFIFIWYKMTINPLKDHLIADFYTKQWVRKNIWKEINWMCRVFTYYSLITKEKLLFQLTNISDTNNIKKILLVSTLSTMDWYWNAFMSDRSKFNTAHFLTSLHVIVIRFPIRARFPVKNQKCYTSCNICCWFSQTRFCEQLSPLSL